MLKKHIIIVALLICSHISTLISQDLNSKINPHITSDLWDAHWITHTNGNFNLNGAGVYYFRKTFSLNEIDKEFIINVSADNRYKLYINGKYIGNGPARSDVQHWQFDTYNISPQLQKGRNVIAAVVWNWGETGPWAQLKYRTAFILQGNSDKEKIVNTDHTWKVIQDKSYTFLPQDMAFFPYTTGVGGTERIDGSKHIWGWETNRYNDDNWINCTELGRGLPAGINDKAYMWQLIPRQIPFMEESEQRIPRLARVKGGSVSSAFLQGNDVVIPANSKVELLLDQNAITTAYPVLKISSGKDAQIKAIYSESLFDEDMNEVDRNIIGENQARGLYDVFISDGGKNRVYKTLWFRTYRFIQLNIETKGQALTINDFKGVFTAYPFELKAGFECNDPSLNKIFNVGWLTARLCAHENYVDCPYYEQLQYFGDFNISNPVTVLLSGDARLVRNALIQGDDSRRSGELPMCCHPSTGVGKIIPSFAISWIDVLYNYVMYTGDFDFLKRFKQSVEGILYWYEKHLNEDYMLGPMPYWNFIDCTSSWKWDPDNGSICEPPGTKEGYSAILTLQYLYGLEKGIELMNMLDDNVTATHYEELIKKIKKSTFKLCWNEETKYLADTPEKDSYSQHTNVFAVLTGLFNESNAPEVLMRTMSDSSLIQMSLQFRAYFHKAIVKYNIEDQYVAQLDPWKKMLDWGFTTFPEYPDLNTRSDCHAWNAYPSYELLNIVCGINISEPGFKAVTIEPHLGGLEWAKGSMPYKDSKISVNLFKNGETGIKGSVTMPEGLSGTFVHGKKKIDLKAGKNTILIKK